MLLVRAVSALPRAMSLCPRVPCPRSDDERYRYYSRERSYDFERDYRRSRDRSREREERHRERRHRDKDDGSKHKSSRRSVSAGQEFRLPGWNGSLAHPSSLCPRAAGGRSPLGQGKEKRTQLRVEFLLSGEGGIEPGSASKQSCHPNKSTHKGGARP